MEERLIIKNFGPIKHIDIPIRKVNVLIGDQGTGKSTVAKVLAIVKDLVFIINPNITTILNFYNLQHYVNDVDTEIYFASEHYEFKFNSTEGLNIIYSNEFKNLFDLYKSELNIANQNNSSAKQLVLNDIAVKMNGLVGGVWYIPTERANINTHKNSGLNSQNYFQRFAENYVTERNRVSSFEIPFLNLKYSYQNNRDVIITKTGTYNLSESASGFQSIVPAMMFAQFFVNEGIGVGYYILEEPELNLFPKTQRDLINYLIGKIYTLNDYMFFTTHSPYILSSLNNLLYAFKIGQTNTYEVNTIIDKKYWVNPSDVSAYLLNDKGEAEDLMDLELQQIAVERIDEISQTINEEYDKLSDIKWAKK